MSHNIFLLIFHSCYHNDTSMSGENQKRPYIRFPGEELMPAKPHQVSALQNFNVSGAVDGTIISVPHPAGGIFRATFYKRSDDDCFYYIPENGRMVEMFLLTPEKAAFVKRITE